MKTLKFILLLAVGFLCKSYKPLIVVFSGAGIMKGQEIVHYNWNDSSRVTIGNWSEKVMKVEGDSIYSRGWKASYRITTPIVESRNLSAEFPNINHDTLLCTNPNGRLYKRTVASLNIPTITPQVTQTLTGINGIIVTTAPNTFTISRKRQETYTGTSNASGTYTVAFAQAYSVAPNVQAALVTQSVTNQYVRISAVSTTGFTVNVYAFNSLNIAGVVALLPTTANVSGATIDVLVTEK